MEKNQTLHLASVWDLGEASIPMIRNLPLGSTFQYHYTGMKLSCGQMNYIAAEVKGVACWCDHEGVGGLREEFVMVK